MERTYQKGELVKFLKMIGHADFNLSIRKLKEGDLGIYLGIGAEDEAPAGGYHVVYWQRLKEKVGVYCSEFELAEKGKDDERS